MTLGLPFDNSYARLPARLFARLDPTPVVAPRLVRVNAGLAESIGLDPEELASPEGVEVLAGNRVPEGATPIALAYAGHQFGHFVPQLGDGRAILLGEVVGQDGLRRDLQLLAADLLGRLAANDVDHTLFFRRLCASAADVEADGEVAALFTDSGAFHEWAGAWRRR